MNSSLIKFLLLIPLELTIGSGAMVVTASQDPINTFGVVLPLTAICIASAFASGYSFAVAKQMREHKIKVSAPQSEE